MKCWVGKCLRTDSFANIKQQITSGNSLQNRANQRLLKVIRTKFMGHIPKNGNKKTSYVYQENFIGMSIDVLGAIIAMGEKLELLKDFIMSM